MTAPYEYPGRGDTCMGCVDIIRQGDMVGAMSAERPDHVLCIACWWLQECDLELPAWGRGARRRGPGY